MRLKLVYFIYVRHKIATKGWLRFAYLLSFLLFSVRIIPLDPCLWHFCRQWFISCSPSQELHINSVKFPSTRPFSPCKKQKMKWVYYHTASRTRIQTEGRVIFLYLLQKYPEKAVSRRDSQSKTTSKTW